MSKFICGSCEQLIPDHKLRGSRAHEAGQVVCMHCGALLAVAVQPRPVRFYLLSIGCMVAGTYLVFADQAIWKAVGALGIAAFVAAMVHSHRASRKLTVIPQDGS